MVSRIEIAGPQRLPSALPDGEIMQRGEADEIARGDQRAPRDIGEISGHLRPEGGLGVHVLADDDRPEILQLLRRRLNAFLHFADGAAEGADRQMMIAEDRLTGDELVARGVDRRFDFRPRFVRRGDLALDLGDVRHDRRAIFEREGLRDDHFMGNAQEPVEHPGAGVGRILADREHRGEPCVASDAPRIQEPSCRR